MNGGSIHVAVLSLHIVPGEEFQNLCRDVEKIQSENGRLRKVEIARPLLGNAEDMKTVCEILVGRFPRKGPYEGVIFVGHGNLRHPSDAIYSHMNSFLAARRSGFFVGTVQGRPTPDELLPELKAAGITKVLLVPLMTLAGEHARKDMAGDGPESWKSVLDANGIESEPVFTGLAEDQDVVGVWLNHLEEAFSTL
jgi:sirohydrochlorin cobaltochelatase